MLNTPDPTSPSYTEARFVIEQKIRPDGEIDARVSFEITPYQDQIKMVVHGRVGPPQTLYLNIETADAMNNALVSTIDQLEEYIERDNKYFLPEPDNDTE